VEDFLGDGEADIILARLFHWSPTAQLAPAFSVQAISALELYMI
jgi:hypothetical protein